MAELCASYETGDTPDQPLRLVINWTSITTRADVEADLESEYEIGLFMGDDPLFCDAAYSGPLALPARSSGFFRGESDGCALLIGLKRALLTGERVVIDDLSDWTKIIIESDIFADRQPTADKPDADGAFQVIVIVLNGGPWQGRVNGESGPGAMFDVDRDVLENFFRDLLREALCETVSDRESCDRLERLFASEFKEIGCPDTQGI